MIPSFLPLPVLFHKTCMILPKFNPSACILQQKYLVLVNSASLLILSSWLIYDGFCTKYHVLYGGNIGVFRMSLIPIMIQNIYIMGCYILIHLLSRIIFTHWTLKLLTIQIWTAAVMVAEINFLTANHKAQFQMKWSVEKTDSLGYQ